jgi:hypothetical protein
MEAGDLCYKKKRKRRKHFIKKDDATGNIETAIKDQIATDNK